MQTRNAIELPTGFFPVVKEILLGEVFLVMIGANVHEETKECYKRDLKEWSTENDVDVSEIRWKSGDPKETRLSMLGLRDHARESKKPIIIFYESPLFSNIIDEYADVAFKLRQAASPGANVELSKLRRPGEEGINRQFSPIVHYTCHSTLPESSGS